MTNEVAAGPELGIGLSVGSSASHYATSDESLSVQFALLVNAVRGGLFVTHHECDMQADGVEIGVGRPVTPAEVTRLLSPLLGEMMAWQPPHVLARSPDHLCWWVPPAVRNLHFRIGQKIVRYRVPLPGLVLCASHGRSLRIFAVKGQQRPGRETRLFHAPLMNIDRRGFMCFGNIETPTFGLEHLPEWESALFDTCFTHVNHQQTLQKPEDVDSQQLLAFWRNLRGKSVFPDDVLAACSERLWS